MMETTQMNKQNNCDAAILEFGEIMDGLISGKLILADKKISEVLQLIAGNKKLYTLIKVCTQGFDFSGALNGAVSDDTGAKKLGIETQPPAEQIAFVFCVLYSVDTKKLEFNDFLQTYFTADSAQAEYESFAKSLLKPFKNLVIDAFMRGSVTPEFHPPQVTALSSDVKKKITPSKEMELFRPKIDFTFSDDMPAIDEDDFIDDIRIDTLLKVCREILGISARDPDILPLEREEILVICEAFEKALEFGGKNAVRIMYIGLKNTLNCSSISRKIAMQTDDLNRLMLEYLS